MGLAAIAVGLFSILTLPAPAMEKATPPNPIRIGVMNTLFQDTPKPLLGRMLKPFQSFMEAQTGLHSQVLPAEDAAKLGRQLANKEVHFGVFHGFEFAWARQQYPELKPLVVAQSDQRLLRACLVVHQNSDVADIDGLQGKSLAIPFQVKEHCRLLVERHCQDCGQTLKSYFAQITSPANQEIAMDDVVDGVVQAALVDGQAFDSFQKRKPGRWAKLKVAQESEAFPGVVVAHRPKVLDPATVQLICTGLLKAHQTRQGASLLTFAGINGFKTVPKDYDAALSKIAKAYPPPSKETR